MSQKVFSFIRTKTAITVHIAGRMRVVGTADPMFQKLVEAIQANDYDQVNSCLDLVGKIAEASKGEIVVRDDKVYYNQEEVHGAVVQRLLEMIRDSFDVTGIKLFIQNVMQNPAEYARTELYEFMELCGLPITPDGCFIAYKMVRDDYTDCRTGNIRNMVGDKPWMKREDVNPDRYQTCEAGLHFCSFHYITDGHFYQEGYRVMAVKINPADVVSIPVDYNFSKGRAWRYEVVDEVTEDFLAQRSENLARMRQIALETADEPTFEEEEESSEETGDEALDSTFEPAEETESSDKDVCGNCGGTHTHKKGKTLDGKRRRIKCLDCGANTYFEIV